MKSLTTPKAIIISGIVIALSVVLSSFITSHWLNETNKELSNIESQLNQIESELSSMNQWGIETY